jgi:small subunit ribosomal protein S17e
MGRIKTKLIQAITHELVEKHRAKLSTDVEVNKQVVKDETDIFSKKIRNAVAGYAVRLLKEK